jgi:hypothetical protein
MKARIFGVVLLVIAIGCISLGVFFTLQEKDTKTESIGVIDYSYGETQTLDVCVSSDNCSVLPAEYSPLVYNTSIIDIQNMVNEVNADMKKYYEEAASSTLDDASCASVRNIYKHSLLPHFDITIYESKELTNITASYLISNLCLDSVEYLPLKSFAYDKEEKKVLNQEEFKKKYDITDQEIELAIQEDINSNNSINQTQYTLDDTRSRDYVVYFDRDGNLNVSYYLDPMQMYYFISLS